MHGREGQALGSGRIVHLGGDAHLVDLRVNGQTDLADRMPALRLNGTNGPRANRTGRVKSHHRVGHADAVLQAIANLKRHDDAAAIAFTGNRRRRQGDRQI